MCVIFPCDKIDLQRTIWNPSIILRHSRILQPNVHDRKSTICYTRECSIVTVVYMDILWPGNETN